MIVAKLKKKLPLIALFLLLTVFSFLQVSCIFRESRTYDEILHLEAGLAFWRKGDFTVEPFNPPLAREIVSLPLLLKKNFINDPFLFWPRAVVVTFSLGLLCVIYCWTNKIYSCCDKYSLSKWPGILSLLLAVFTPEILAHSHYANTDLIVTFLAVLSLFLFDQYFLNSNRHDLKCYFLLGLVVGLSLATKTTAIFFVLLPITIWWIFFLKKDEKPTLKELLAFIFSICLIVWLTYFFTLEPVLGYRADPNRQALQLIKKYPRTSFLLNTPVPLGGYLSTLKQNILYNQTSKFPRNTVFWGRFRQGAPGIYLWPVFLIKTPIPLLILIFCIFFKKNLSKSEKFLKFIFILVFIEMIFLGSNLRLRYFLIVYPVLAILAGVSLGRWLQQKKIWRKFLVGVLVIWLITRTLSVYPHFLTFFNETVPENKGYQYVVDSNLDWGEGLVTLQKFLQGKKINSVQLAYFGSVEPSIYGMSYQRIKDANLKSSQNYKQLDITRPLVISASCWYYCDYFQDEKLSKLKPKVLAGQFLLFNF